MHMENSLYTAALVFKLRRPQCLVTPIFILMASFNSFFSLFIEVRYIFIQEIVQTLTGSLLFHLPYMTEDKLKSRRTVRFG